MSHWAYSGSTDSPSKLNYAEQYAIGFATVGQPYPSTFDKAITERQLMFEMGRQVGAEVVALGLDNTLVMGLNEDDELEYDWDLLDKLYGIALRKLKVLGIHTLNWKDAQARPREPSIAEIRAEHEEYAPLRRRRFRRQ